MTWQELLLDVAPLVVSFVSAIVLFCRTGQKRYIDRFTEALQRSLPQTSKNDVFIYTDDGQEFEFDSAEYGMKADEFLTVIKSYLESVKNGDSK